MKEQSFSNLGEPTMCKLCDYSKYLDAASQLIGSGKLDQRQTGFVAGTRAYALRTHHISLKQKGTLESIAQERGIPVSFPVIQRTPYTSRKHHTNESMGLKPAAIKPPKVAKPVAEKKPKQKRMNLDMTNRRTRAQVMAHLRSDNERVAIVHGYSISGLSRTKYAKSVGIVCTTLSRWIKDAAKNPSPAQIVLPPAPATAPVSRWARFVSVLNKPLFGE